jgi:TorA maturation chaperone TorD
MMIQSGNSIDRAAARASLFTLLAQSLNYPDGELIDGLVRGSFTGQAAEALETLGIGSMSDNLEALDKEYAGREADRAALLLEIEKDYTRMCFASKPRLVYLFESVYREGKLYEESTFQIARLYYDAGLKVEEAFRLPPDHIAVELEFMAFLAFKEAEGIGTGDEKIRDYAVELRNKTLEEHLHPFALAIAERLGKHARTNFYRTVAGILTVLLSDPAHFA